MATRTRSGLPGTESLLFAAVAEEEEHPIIVERRRSGLLDFAPLAATPVTSRHLGPVWRISGVGTLESVRFAGTGPSSPC